MGRGSKQIFYVKVLTHAYGKGETRLNERFAHMMFQMRFHLPGIRSPNGFHALKKQVKVGVNVLWAQWQPFDRSHSWC